MIKNDELSKILIRNAKNLRILEFNVKMDITITSIIFRNNHLALSNESEVMTNLLKVVKVARKQLGHIIKFGILSEKDKSILSDIISLNKEYNFKLSWDEEKISDENTIHSFSENEKMSLEYLIKPNQVLELA